MSNVGKVLLGFSSAHDVVEVIQKSAELVAVISAANDTELDDLRKKLAQVWHNSIMGLLALRMMPDYSWPA